jgi:peptidyl-prolyl cis-trans isomerase D
MMQSVRSVATKVAAVIFGALMLIFVLQLSGIFDSQTNIFTRTSVGSVNGKAIDLRAYEAVVQQAIEQRQRETPGRMSLEDVEQLRNQVWDQFVQQAVLEQKYAAAGITVTQDEVVQALRNEPPREVVQSPEFQTDGRFDLAKYQRWLTTSAAAPLVEGLAAQYREELRRNKLLQQVTSDVYLSDAALWQRYRDQKEMVTVSLTAIVPSRVVPDSAVGATPAEVSEYYRTHTDEFKRPATAFLSYVTLPRLTDASDSAAALERARAIRAEIAGGAPFEEVAQRESADTGSAVKGGDLGEFGRGVMDPAFEQAAFTLPVKALSEPVLSQFGYHIIQVTSRGSEKVSARHILVPVELAGAHRDQLDAQADSLDRLAVARTDAGALDDVAKGMGIQVRQAEPVQQGGRVLVGNAAVPDAGVWAFQAREGTLSDVVETTYALYLFRLDSLQEAGVPKLETIRGAVEQAVRDGKKAAKARAVADAYLARVQGGESMADAAKAMGLPNQEFGPFARINPPLNNPAVVGAAFALQPGERSGVIVTDEGLYVLQAVSRTPADREAYKKQIEEFRPRAFLAARQERVRNYLQGLKDEATIVDDREEIYRRGLQQAQAPLGS